MEPVGASHDHSVCTWPSIGRSTVLRPSVDRPADHGSCGDPSHRSCPPAVGAQVVTRPRVEPGGAPGGQSVGERLRDDVEGLVQQGVGGRERRQEAEHVAPGAAGQRDHAVAVAVRVDRGRTGRVRRAGLRVDELDRHHRAAAADVGDHRVLAGQVVQPGAHEGTDLAGPAGQVVLPHLLDRAEGGRAGDRVAAVRPAEAADVDGVHQLGAAGDRGQRHAAGDALGGGDQVGHDALVVAGEPVAGAAEAGLDLVGDEDDPVRLGSTPCSAGRKPSAGTTKPPSPRIGSITRQARLAAPTCLSSTSIARAAASAPRQPVAHRVGHRRPVDLARERPEAVLVGHVLGGHRHRQVGAAVVGVVEDRDRVAAGRRRGRSSRRSRPPRRRS